MEYTQFLVILNFVGGLTRKRYLCEVEPLVNTVLMSNGQHKLWILSARPLKLGRHTVVILGVSSSIFLSRFLGADVMRTGLLLRLRLCLKLIISSSWYAPRSLLMAFARYCKQQTIPFFTLYGWWELKLRYCPVKVGLRYTDDLNKGRGSKFRVGPRVQQTPEGRRTYQPKRCDYNNKDEDNSLKTLNDNDHQASSQKFRQLISSQYGPDTIHQ